jgi:uracil phosphoribosyltransferase
MREYVANLRDIARHGNREQFRATMGKVGFVLAYELSKTLEYEEVDIETPLAVAVGHRLTAQPVVGTILRAGLPLYDGVMQAFPEADSAFIAAYRKHGKDADFTVQTDYVTCPDLAGRALVLADPMLATGSSLIDGLDRLVDEGGTPSEVHVLAAIAAHQGVEHLQSQLERRAFARASIWCAAIDPTLNEHKYIEPGLGDAGDLAFGAKIQN